MLCYLVGLALCGFDMVAGVGVVVVIAVMMTM